MEHFMTTEEVAEFLHVDPVTIRRLVTKGELSAYRIGADYRFAPSDVHDYLQRQYIAAHAQNESGSSSSNTLEQFTQLFRKVIQGKQTTSSAQLQFIQGKQASPLELLLLFDQLTKHARHVLALAQEEALRLRHTYIGTEHLLLGLLREKEGGAAEALINLGVEEDQVRHAVEGIIGRGKGVVLGEITLTPRITHVFELAQEEAHLLNHPFIGTEHLLLGLLREDGGIASGVFRSLDLQLEQIRTETLRVLHQRQQGQ